MDALGGDREFVDHEEGISRSVTLALACGMFGFVNVMTYPIVTSSATTMFAPGYELW